MTQWPGYQATKRTLISTLSGTVLEIGAGRGANLPLLPACLDWTGLEPHARTRRALTKAAERSQHESTGGRQVLAGRAEEIPLPTASIDVVLSTAVLCSVDDVGAVLTEIRRVLRPGGRFVFLEHVAAPRESGLFRLQRAIAPITRVVDRGCDPSRDLAPAIAAAFSEVHLDRHTASGLLKISFIAGTARA
ncbi:class I SAM-dependent methyltransferase [Kribbella sp. CA-293567]|uniref:class I SAM-dependent methyltransferase n=1 Tax=Kribbella sp. CA-293567 TaxID=3002436 RepID=UPI0022DD50AA|nr:class I SAM-dependent methyltransferase [Kribbella sp. CA-293567]WBQ08087.1 class I SAM-dependent methyltransferase [Kribbella sp. CA-293567]